MERSNNKRGRRITFVSWHYHCPCGKVHHCTYASDEGTAEENGRNMRDLCASHSWIKECSEPRVTSAEVPGDLMDWEEVPW